MSTYETKMAGNHPFYKITLKKGVLLNATFKIKYVMYVSVRIRKYLFETESDTTPPFSI